MLIEISANDIDAWLSTPSPFLNSRVRAAVRASGSRGSQLALKEANGLVKITRDGHA